MSLRTEASVLKPVCRKFVTTIGHVTAAEHTEFEHFLRGQLRLKLRVEIFTQRFRQVITVSLLHLVIDDDCFLHLETITKKPRKRAGLFICVDCTLSILLEFIIEVFAINQMLVINVRAFTLLLPGRLHWRYRQLWLVLWSCPT